jgi:hypothetical protein
MRRKRWEARVQAVETANAIAVLFGGSEKAEKGQDRVSADTLLGMMGQRP